MNYFVVVVVTSFGLFLFSFMSVCFRFSCCSHNWATKQQVCIHEWNWRRKKPARCFCMTMLALSAGSVVSFDLCCVADSTNACFVVFIWWTMVFPLPLPEPFVLSSSKFQTRLVSNDVQELEILSKWMSALSLAINYRFELKRDSHISEKKNPKHFLSKCSLHMIYWNRTWTFWKKTIL